MRYPLRLGSSPEQIARSVHSLGQQTRSGRRLTEAEGQRWEAQGVDPGSSGH